MIVKVPETNWTIYTNAVMKTITNNGVKTLKGDVLYKPDLDCYYCSGESIPAKIVASIVDDEKTLRDKLQEFIDDIQS